MTHALMDIILLKIFMNLLKEFDIIIIAWSYLWIVFIKKTKYNTYIQRFNHYICDLF